MEFPRSLKLEFVAMLDRLKAMPGGDVVEGLAGVLATTEPAVGVRVNMRKNAMPSGMREVPWADRGFYVDGDRPRFTMDPALHQGRYYVQDPSSMALSAIVGQLVKKSGQKPILYIDACAAPGGKTTAAIDALPPGSLIVANEFDRRRADALTENVIKWGYPDCVVTQGDTARFRRLPEIADIIAVDAPCSGEGMMRKEDAAVEQWSDGLVERCAGLQREILDNMWTALRPGGYLIYSTCTFNRLEDEENLEYIVNELGGEPVALELPFDSGIVGAIASPYPAYRFLPGKVEGEGLFIAVARKIGSVEKGVRLKNYKKKPHQADALITESADYLVEERDGRVVAVSGRWYSMVEELRRNLNVIYCGVEIGKLVAPANGGKRSASAAIVPSQALALSIILAEGAFPRMDVDYPTAVAYLRGEALRLDSAEKGYLLLTYEGVPLGFVKNLGNRANNLYPDSWKIRSTHIPSEPPVVLS